MIVSKVYNWLQNSTSIEIHCLLCRGKAQWQTPICDFCLDSCSIPEWFCSLCGLPFHDASQENETGLCNRCIHQAPVFDVCLSAYLYEYPINAIIQRVKYQRRLELIKPITRRLSDTLRDYYLNKPWPETLIPIPLHNKRLRERGYDQALLLAKAITRQIRDNAPTALDTHILKRTRATPPQQGLNARARRKNIKHAFSLQRGCNYKHVALIDDVVTTGETVSEATRLLKKSGIRQVDIWCLARTPQAD